MTFRFGDFELDEERRELRHLGREVVVQPLVFDLIAYLVRHRDRVVEKQELLDRLWEDSLVVDGALQRVVSLARTALKEGGAESVIRTYPRRGYRFCGEILTTAPAEGPPKKAPNALALAREAFEAADLDRAIDRFAAADGEEELDGPDLERWAQAIISSGRLSEAVAPLERAVATYSLQRDRPGAARAALKLASIQFERREMSVAKGWRKRAASFLSGLEEGREHASLEWVSCRFALIEGDLEQSLAHAEKARDLGRRLESSDHEALGLAYGGHALIGLGQLEQGVGWQDEAAAAVLAGEVSPWTGGMVYCSVIWACRNIGDWKRAGQWTDQFTRWCRSSPVASFPGTCQLHRAEVLSVRGELLEAEAEVSSAFDQLASSAPWAEGDAHRVRGDIFLLRGDLENAEREFRLAHQQGWDPQPGYALLQNARGKPEAALKGLERSLSDPAWSNRQRRTFLLTTVVRIAACAGKIDRAREALAELESIPQFTSMTSQAAALATASAELAVAEGRRSDALQVLRRARGLWEEIGSPMNVAESRLRMGEILLADDDPDAAELEVSAATSIAKRLELGPLLERCENLRGLIEDIKR